jgi:putative ABC transport system ATP-binding protein
VVVAPEGSTRTGAPVLEAHNLYRFFHLGDEETFALRGVSLSLGGGEMLAITGPSGSGKSTLLACLAGLDEPDGGHVVVGGQRLTRRPEATRAALRSRWIGVLLQSGNLLDHLTVEQNIDLVRGLNAGDRARTVSDLLAEVGLEERASAWPTTLSGGEAARAGMATALANDPAVILADEPTGEVDRENESRILSLLRRNTEAGAGVVVVTHSDRVAGAADRVLRLTDGRITDG